MRTFLCSAILLTSLATGSAQPEAYVIGPRDSLLVVVTDEPDLSGKFSVDVDGTITLAYLNRVKLAGLTLSEAQVQLTKLLKDGSILRNPQVRIEMDQFKSRKVTVTGEVRTPATFTMTGTAMTLLEALAAAGSPTSNAANEILVQHQAADGKLAAPVTVNRNDLMQGRSNLTLQDGDVVNVPVAKRFYIQGFVKNTGSYVLDPGTTVSQAIILAGGLSERGSDGKLKITRTVNGKPVEFKVKLETKVLPDDQITVGARFF
jgi:polysaccharide export outer membrane protein